MNSVVETIENGSPTAVAVQTQWLKNNKLYWPPGKNIDRQTPSHPQENWMEFDYKILKSGIETFAEAIVLEKRYEKHRDSNSFREFEEKKKLKRQHPVNYAEPPIHDLIDVNDMVRKINENSAENNIPKNADVRQDIPIRPAVISSPMGVSFEERVLKELGDLKKTQQSFEARIESRINTFINDQSRTLGNGHSRLQGSSQSFLHCNGPLRFQGNSQPCVRGNYQSAMQFQSRHYRGTRNEGHIRHREPTSPERYVDDFEEFEELDRNFPIRSKNTVPDLEYNIRKDLEFKFLLNSRLNELSGSNYKKCIREKMKYLFTDPVLECFTWNGTMEKDAFKQLKVLNALILRSVRDRCPNTRLDEYKDYMGDWLKHAKSRQRQVTYTYPEPKNMNDDFDIVDDDEN